VGLGTIVAGSIGSTIGLLLILGAIGAAWSQAADSWSCISSPDGGSVCDRPTEAERIGIEQVFQFGVAMTLIGFVVISIGVAMVCHEENREYARIASQPVQVEFDRGLDELLEAKRARALE